MLKRTIYIGNPAYIKLKQQQLKIVEPDSGEEKGSVVIEDMGLLVLDHAQITMTTQALQKLMQHTVAVVNCDAQHLPNGLMLPLQGHSELTQRWHHQINASQPLKKQLWKQTVIAKIENQRDLLAYLGHETESMNNYIDAVTSGDEGNMEGKAARHYWKHLLDDFTRDPEGDYPNSMLNFGYAILRSMVARALISSGLLPALGIFHSNKYNPYCLADDIMEPYRCWVDKLVLDWLEQAPEEQQLDKAAKAHLLELLIQDVVIEKKQRPLMIAITSTTSSLQDCFQGEKRRISYPALDL